MKFWKRNNHFLYAAVVMLLAFGLTAFAQAPAAAPAAQATPAPDIRILMEQLNDVRTVRRDTVDQILKIARKDPRAREYVVQKLPDLIGRPESDVWLDAIRLAGKLKA